MGKNYLPSFISGKTRCPYIGEPENGYVTPKKNYYDQGDELEISCQVGFESNTDIKPKCLSTGNWSTALPLCSNSSTSLYP